MRLSRFGFLISGALCVASILLFIFVGLNYGVDFKGGTVIIVRTEQPANIDQLRGRCWARLRGAELQNLAPQCDVLIRLATAKAARRRSRTV